MLSFLPLTNRKRVITEYLSRVNIVLLAFILLAVIILIILFVPSAIYSKYKNATVSNQFLITKANNPNDIQNPIELIKKLNSMITILSSQKGISILMSDMVQKILSIKNKNIQLTNISISKDNDTIEKIVLSGVAKTRDDLTQFNNDLKNDGSFASVDLPITALIKNTDAQFTVTLTYNKK